ncbi:MAG: YbaK/EbsC family protein [Firmicutes bacterium]|nr:YbaK/EbsC family protein [Bacillota bacterium]
MSSSAQRFQEVLARSGIAAKVLELPQSTRTAREAAVALDCDMAQIAKSLIFRRLDTDEPVLVVASGPNRVDEEIISAFVGAPIAMADGSFVRCSTGYAIGGVPPLGHNTPLETVIDQDLLNFEFIWAAAGTPRSVFSITPQQLVKVTQGRVLRVTAP